MGWDIKPPGSGGGTEKPPVGNHLAVLVGLFELGHHWRVNKKPKTPKDVGYWEQRAHFVWELVGEKIAGTTKNHVIAAEVTLSLGENANLRKWVKARTGVDPLLVPGWSVVSELGQPCMLNVVAVKSKTSDKEYANVGGMAAVPNVLKGVVPKPGYTPVAIPVEDLLAGAPVPEWCPWSFGRPIQDKVRESRENGGKPPADAPPVPATDPEPVPTEPGKEVIPF